MDEKAGLFPDLSLGEGQDPQHEAATHHGEEDEQRRPVGAQAAHEGSEAAIGVVEHRMHVGIKLPIFVLEDVLLIVTVRRFASAGEHERGFRVGAATRERGFVCC